MGDGRWATWLVSRRGEIERVLPGRLGAPPPDAASPESEALRRFRSFASSSLRRNGRVAAPAVDGLRVDTVRTERLLEAWCEAACSVAGTEGDRLRERLSPLAERFRHALLAQTAVRRARGATRVTRRAVPAAIDRVADAFLAVDVDNGTIVDANPAACTLLGMRRDALVGGDARRFLDAEEHGRWQTHLEALAESPEPRRFQLRLGPGLGATIPVELSATRYTQRARTLALVVARPIAGAPAAPLR